MTDSIPSSLRFDPWLRATQGTALARITADTLANLRDRETRTRERRPDDARNFAGAVATLIANLARSHFTDGRPVSLPAFNGLGRNPARSPRSPFAATSENLPAACIPVGENLSGACIVSKEKPRGSVHRKDRYRAPVCGSFLPALLAAMESAGYLVLRIGAAAVHEEDRRPSTISPSGHLLALFSARGVSLNDIRREPGEELVLLKADKDEAERAGELVNYTDGELSNGYRRQMRELNAWLAAADITYTGPARVSVRDRHLVRRFTCGDPTFSCGGRLWGGWWYGLSKQQRHEGIRIGGEHIVGLDFKEMAVRTAYAMLRLNPPDDGYTLNGAAAKVPRDTVKLLVSAALFHNKGKRLAGWPGKDVKQREALRNECRGLRLSAVLKAIEAKHPALAPHLYRGIGHATQHMESEVVLDTLSNLRHRGIVALPVHDCIYVPASHETEAVQVMAACWERALPWLSARITVAWLVNGKVGEYDAWNSFHMTAAERVNSATVADTHRVPTAIVSDIREPAAIEFDNPLKGKSREEAVLLVKRFIEDEGYCPPWMPRWMS